MSDSNNNAWSPAQIACVGAQVSELPTTALHWTSMREVAPAVQTALTEVNEAMAAVETSTDFTPDGAARHRRAIALDAINKLAERSKLDAAKTAAERRRAALKAKVSPKTEKTAEDIALAAEIRAHLMRTDKAERLMTATTMVRSDKRAAEAILGESVPHFLTGLDPAQLAALRGALPADETPEGRELLAIERALKLCDGAIASATSMIAQRAGLRRGQDGAWQ
jgi:hypothetical protein